MNSRALAKKLGVTQRRANQLRKEAKEMPEVIGSRERYEKARADKTEADAAAAKIELEKVKGDLVSRQENADSLREIIEQVKAAIYFECGEQLAIQNEGLSAEKQIKNNRDAIARAFRGLEEWSRKRLQKT